MRVALFTETFLPKVDGIVTVTCLLLDHLAERGIESVIVAPRLGEIDRYADTEVRTIPGVSLPWYPEAKFAPAGLPTYNFLKEFKPDVAHFIHPLVVGTSGMLMAKSMNIPTLASFHLDMAQMAQHYRMGFARPILNKYTQIMFNAADYALAPSRMVQSEMQAIGVKEVGLWKRGVDAEKFNPRHYSDDMRYQLSNGHPDETLLLFVGRLGTEKQVDQLKPIVEHLPNTRLAIVGDGPERENLEAHFAGTNTQFMGYMTGEPLSQAYASADVFVFPSALETFGLVVVEAMAAGLPVVASRVGGIPDVVDEGRLGYTFEVGDIKTMIEGVARIATSRERIAQMGQDARAFAETQSWPAMMDEVIDHYERLIMTANATQAIA